MVLGEPAFIAYGPLNPDNMDSLLIVAPWKGKRWSRACPVSIRSQYRYEVTRLYCDAMKKVCDAAPAWLRQLNSREFEYFPLKLAGHLYIGAAGRWVEYHTAHFRSHWLFILSQVPNAGSQRLAVAAAFTVHRLTSSVRSIEARNASASVSQPESTRIPAF